MKTASRLAACAVGGAAFVVVHGLADEGLAAVGRSDGNVPMPPLAVTVIATTSASDTVVYDTTTDVEYPVVTPETRMRVFKLF